MFANCHLFDCHATCLVATPAAVGSKAVVSHSRNKAGKLRDTEGCVRLDECCVRCEFYDES